MILYDIVINCHHYFFIHFLSYEANYFHCFQGKMMLKLNFSSGVSNDTLVYSFNFEDRVAATIGDCNCVAFMISAVIVDKRCAPPYILPNATFSLHDNA